MTSPLILVSDDLCKIPGHPKQLGDLYRGFGQQFVSLLRHSLIDKTKGNTVEREVGGTHRKCSRNGVEPTWTLCTKLVGFITPMQPTVELFTR